MADKKTRNKKGKDGPPERKPSLVDERKRFGAVAFFDSQTESNDDEGVILSFDSLREALVAYDGEEREPIVLPMQTPMIGESRLPDGYADDSNEPINDGEHADAVDLNPRIILEAMLFIGDRENRSLTPQRATEQMRNVTVEEIDAAVTELNRTYHRFGCPYHIVADEDGYRMVLRPEFESIRGKFYGKVREATLSQQAIETLAVVAYRQPISAETIQELRKAPSANVLTQLVRRGLLSVVRETRNKKKVSVYRTTDRFLELFRLDSLDDLPFPIELD